MQELDSLTVQRAARGDHQAFRRLYDTYAPFLWKVLFPMAGRDMMLAKELLQDTFVRVHGVLRTFKGGSALSTWLYRIAYTTAMSYFRRNSRLRSQPLDDRIESSGRSDEFDDHQLAGRILRSLTPDERFLLVAREVNDISFDDLAEVTGQTSGALRTRLHRIKAAVRASFPMEHYAAAGGMP
jgi:RNA polymerase sigma-70 factor (ECF subfamily)